MDTSPGTDADFIVAATFDEEPVLEDINLAIVECLEGSEREDEIVAQQMQQALELDMMNEQQGVENLEKDDNETENDESENGDVDDDDDDFDLYDLWNEDSI